MKEEKEHGHEHTDGHRHTYQNVSIKNLPDSEIEIEAEIGAEEFEKYWVPALTTFTQLAELPGFRPGKAPEKLVLEKFGEMKILEEAAEMAIGDAYPHIVSHEKIDVLGRPSVSITKIARGNPLMFKVVTAVFPAFELKDYSSHAKEIALQAEKVSVSEKELEDTILEIRKSVALRTKTPPEISEEKGEKKEPELPELTDESVKTFGKFDSIADFKEKIQGSILKEKEYREKEKIRTKIVEKLVKDTEISVPKILLEEELERMMAQMKDDITRMGMKFDEYVKQVGKSETEIKNSFTDSAKDRVRLELILGKVADLEKIAPTEEEIEKETSHIVEHHKDADPKRVRAYITHILRKEKVFEFLEGQK
ncbi:MAG: trigger factor [Patescibacteria group bacterium]